MLPWQRWRCARGSFCLSVVRPLRLRRSPSVSISLAVPSIGLRLPERGRLCCSSPPRIARSAIAISRKCSGSIVSSRRPAFASGGSIPIPRTQPEVVRRHQQQFDIHGDTVLDTEQRLTTMAHATITPEVAVFVPGKDTLREVYRGRIDDRYLSLGQERPSADKHELEIALRALTANRPVPAPGGPPVGCSIVPRSEP